MDDSIHSRAVRVEALLPRILRMVYRSTEDSLLAQLPLAQFRILRVLYGGARTVTSLGEELGLTPSAVTQMANRLQEAGLVERQEDLEDRRVKHLALTGYALSMMEARHQRRVHRMEQVLALLPPERQAQIVQDLEELFRAGGAVSASEPAGYVAEIESAFPISPPFHL